MSVQIMTMEIHLTTCRIQSPMHTSTTAMQDPSPVGSPPHHLPLPPPDKCLEMGTEIMGRLSARR